MNTSDGWSRLIDLSDGTTVIQGGDSPFLRNNEDAALIAKAPEMLSMLRELEWSGVYYADMGMTGYNGAGPGGCPICGNPKGSSHAPDCRLAKLLEDLR